MRIICDKCGTKYRVSDSQVSDKKQSVKCLKCGANIVIQTKKGNDNDLNKKASPQNADKIIPRVIPLNCGDCRYLSKRSGKQYCTFYQKETSLQSPCLAIEILRERECAESERKYAEMMANNEKIYDKVKKAGTITYNTKHIPSQHWNMIKVLSILIFIWILIAVISPNTPDNKAIDTKPMETLAEQFPGPWREDVNIDIIKTLVKNNIKGCGSFVYRPHYRGGYEYLVRCDGYDQGKLYLVLTGTRVVLTVDPDGSL